VFQRGPVIWIDYMTDEDRVRTSLGHNDPERAKQHADQIAAKFGREDSRPRPAVTLAGLLKIYEKEMTPTKAATTQSHDRRTFPLFLRAFGINRRPETLNVRDWQSYIGRRRSGEIAPPRRSTGEPRPVRARIIEQDCKLLLAVLNWAERARDDSGGYLLERNPLRGLAIPKEESPRRPVMAPDLFALVRAKAADLSTSAELFVSLLWFTGHRAASVRQLRWSDVNLDAKFWRSIADAAGIEAGSGIDTHSFRRAFANRLRDVNLRDLKDLGGWKTKKTVVGTYLQPDEDAQRSALERLTAPRSTDSE
jgi:integrase